MDQRVRVTLRGPALAVLCLTEWLHLQGPETPEGDAVTLASDGTVDIYSETAEIWVDLPLPVIYDIIAEGAYETATLRRIAPERPTQPHSATYLLRLELPRA